MAKGKAEWEQTVDAIDDPIDLQDGFVIRRGNRALAQLGHTTVQKIPGRSCHDLVAGRSTPCPGCPLAADVAPSQATRGEVTTDAGLTFEVSLFPLVGSREGWVVRHRDVTLERAAVASAREHERLAAVGRLAAGAAHEINNPLAFLVSNLASLGRDLERIDALSKSLDRILSLAEGGSGPAALAALLRFRGTPHLEALSALAEDGPDRVAESLVGAQRVAGIVRALRTLATERTGGCAPVDATGSLERAAHRLDAEPIESRDLEWVAREPLPVLGQPHGLDEAFYQILRNALQFSPKGAAVRLSTTVRGEVGILRIEDQGPGIAADIRDRILEPFFTTHPPGEGLGLGLTIAYGIVRQHGGQLRVSDGEVSGTVIEVILPLRASAASEGMGDAGPGEAEAAGRLDPTESQGGGRLCRSIPRISAGRA